MKSNKFYKEMLKIEERRFNLISEEFSRLYIQKDILEHTSYVLAKERKINKFAIEKIEELIETIEMVMSSLRVKKENINNKLVDLREKV